MKYNFNEIQQNKIRSFCKEQKELHEKYGG